MDYTEIKELALAYADREDQETTENVDFFLRMVETRVNQILKVQKQTSRTALKTATDQGYYGFPEDFQGLRDVRLVDGTRVRSLEYLTPKQINDKTDTTTDDVYYTIIDDQLFIYPLQDNKTIEIVYYRKVPQLTLTDNTNWVTEEFPDVYVFGLLVEISSFVKDIAATQAWEMRFKESLQNIVDNDQLTRWSGSPLKTRVEE
jgi:hypothetical protein